MPGFGATWAALAAHLALEQGRLDEARRFLAQAEADPTPEVFTRAYRARVRAEVARAEHDPVAALEIYDELIALGADGARPLDVLVGLRERAAVLRHQGDEAAALESYRRADKLIETQAWQVPLGLGRTRFVDTLDGVARQHIALLLKRGQ
ncbi:unnamed protein product, partial [Laminaria digitata]